MSIAVWQAFKPLGYINFRDYLNECPEKAILYDTCKQKLAMQFSNDRKSYTAGKEKIIQRLLAEAKLWREIEINDDNSQFGVVNYETI